MTTDLSTTPDPEFRAHLEWEITRALRREASLGTRHRARRRRRVAIIGIVGACLTLGVASNFAAAQVQQGTRRDSLLQGVEADMALLRLRQQVLQKELAEVERQRQAGVATDDALTAARDAVQSVMSRLARLRLNEEEIRRAAESPRDDLNAPLVGGRDFVKERIEVQIADAQRQVEAAEARIADVDRQVRVGIAGALARSEAEVDLARAREQLMIEAKRLSLRQEYLDKRTPVDQLTRQLDLTQRTGDLAVAVQSLAVAQQRLAEVRRKVQVGAAEQIDALRAELAMKEQELAVQRLRQQLSGIARARPDSLE